MDSDRVIPLMACYMTRVRCGFQGTTIGVRNSGVSRRSEIGPQIRRADIPLPHFGCTRTCNFFISCKQFAAAVCCARFLISNCFKGFVSFWTGMSFATTSIPKLDAHPEVIHGKRYWRDAICLSGPGSLRKAPSNVFRNTPQVSSAEEQGASAALSRASSCDEAYSSSSANRKWAIADSCVCLFGARLPRPLQQFRRILHRPAQRNGIDRDMMPELVCSQDGLPCILLRL